MIMENRIIKFRAWDGKSIIYPDKDGWFNKCSLPDYNKLQDLQIGSVLKKLSVQQFSGLKDKNGVEIYEGDILVKPDKLFMSSVEFKAPKFITRPIMKGLTDYVSELMFVDELEVIGNIYSNPELLANETT